MASPSSPTDSNPPSAVPLPLPAPPSSSSRRLPPPCWTPEETAALIDAYREKWYSLGRTNLKATHWQEVADAVTVQCPNASPAAKTAVQCRHKMEKLRKRYRTEIQRLRSLPVPRLNNNNNNASTSSWVHFKSMDSMEKGPSKPEPNNNLNFIEQEDNEDDDLYEEFKNAPGSNTRSLNKLYKNGPAFRIRIPAGVSVAQHPSSKFFNAPSPGGGGAMPRAAKRERERDALAEMVGAIKVLRDGFVRMEQMKMEMAREIETMRMEMEVKRTEMILDSQQRIVEAFARAVSHKRTKPKSTPSPSQP
ncbi:Trihelix transcription factor ASIL2, partial [Mucuna pruriens]